MRFVTTENSSRLPPSDGCARLRTTANHPAAKGSVERFHRQLKALLRARKQPNNWVENLPLVLLCIRTTVKTDIVVPLLNR